MLTAGYHFLGGVIPASSEIFSDKTVRYGIIHLKLLDDARDAQRLKVFLDENPFACLSICMDATKRARNKHQGVFLGAPCYPKDWVLGTTQYVAAIKTIFIGFSFCPVGTATSMAEMTIRRLREWAQAAPGLFPKLLFAYIWSVVDHSALPEARELSRLSIGAL